MELQSTKDVDVAITKTNNYKLDSKHYLIVTRWSDFDRMAKVDDEYVEPVVAPYKPKVNFQNHFIFLFG